jgi:subtilisin family serine protease
MRKSKKLIQAVASSCVQLLASIVLTSAVVSEVQADAKLLHFDRPASERIPGQYYVLFKPQPELARLPSLYADATSGINKPMVLPENLPTTPQTSRALAEALATSVKGRVIPPYESPYENRLGFWIVMPDSMISVLAKDPRIESIEPNPVIHLATNQQTLMDPQGTENAFYLWHLDRIDQTKLPLDGWYTYYVTGATVQVWILDTGVWGQSADFGNNGGQISIEEDCTSGTCVLPQCPSVPPYGTEQAADEVGHGTAVAGVLAGRIHGVAKDSIINAIKVIGNCTTTNLEGSPTALIAGIEYVINFVKANQKTYPANVINFSGYAPSSPQVDAEVQKALNAGITFVVASPENPPVDACGYSPQEIGPTSALLVVSGSTTNDQMDPLDAYGKCLSIFAPNQMVASAYSPWGAYGPSGSAPCTSPRNVSTDPNIPLTGSEECFFAGTSVGAPIVSGIAALYLQTSPNATPSVVKAAILKSASIQVLGPDKYGSPNALANSCVPGNNPTFDPNAPACPGGSGGDGGGGGLTSGQEAAIETALSMMLLAT